VSEGDHSQPIRDVDKVALTEKGSYARGFGRLKTKWLEDGMAERQLLGEKPDRGP